MEKRWKKRFQTFEKAYLIFEDAAKLAKQRRLSELEEAGVVRRFTILSELSWKVMRDYLISQGVSVKHNPKDAIRHAFQNELIEDGETWMESLEKRDKAARIYDRAILAEVVSYAGGTFRPLARDLHFRLNEKLGEKS